ncbi:MAG: phosphoglyceromutase, partial [Bacteroidota bacterium]
MRCYILLICLFLKSSLSAQSIETQTENVFIITMDGLRWQELFGGAVDSMISNPQLTKDQSRMEEQYLAKTKEERREKLMPFFWETIA